MRELFHFLERGKKMGTFLRLVISLCAGLVLVLAVSVVAFAGGPVSGTAAKGLLPQVPVLQGKDDSAACKEYQSGGSAAENEYEQDGAVEDEYEADDAATAQYQDDDDECEDDSAADDQYGDGDDDGGSGGGVLSLLKKRR